MGFSFIKFFLNLGFANRIFGKKVIHVEAISFTFPRLKRHLQKYRSKCYCITPSNYEYSDSTLTLNMSKKEFYELSKKYYAELRDMGIDLQLHVHLSLFPKRMSYKKKEEMIKSSYDFFVKELKIVPKEIVFGWYSYDDECREISKKMGLKVIDEHLHIYDWWI